MLELVDEGALNVPPFEGAGSSPATGTTLGRLAEWFKAAGC